MINSGFKVMLDLSQKVLAYLQDREYKIHKFSLECMNEHHAAFGPSILPMYTQLLIGFTTITKTRMLILTINAGWSYILVQHAIIFSGANCSDFQIPIANPDFEEEVFKVIDSIL